MLLLTLDLRRGDSRYRLAARPQWRTVDPDEAISITQAAAMLQGKRCAVLIHGYNVGDEMDSLGQVALRLHAWGSYDAAVFVRWPGGRVTSFAPIAAFLGRLTPWGSVFQRADQAGRMIADAWPRDAGPVDIQAHSLGCRVALAASQRPALRVRNLILAAAAVDNEALRLDYRAAVDRVQRVLVAYSAHDPALRAYWFARWDSALGRCGPDAALPAHVTALDLSTEVWSHGGYKRSEQFYAAWRTLAAGGMGPR